MADTVAHQQPQIDDLTDQMRAVRVADTHDHVAEATSIKSHAPAGEYAASAFDSPAAIPLYASMAPAATSLPTSPRGPGAHMLVHPPAAGTTIPSSSPAIPSAAPSAPGSPGMGMGLATAAASALVTNDAGEPIVSMRVLLTSKAAGVCIGVRGATMDALRRASGAKAGVSKLIEGVNDRVLNLVGTVTELSKAILFVATTLAQHPITSPEAAAAAAAGGGMGVHDVSSSATTLRLLVPNAVMGSLIGRGGLHIKQMQEAHATRMVTAKECLPLSTERTVDVTGAPLAIANTAGEIAALVADEWDRVVQTTRLYDPRVRVPSVGYTSYAAMQQQQGVASGTPSGSSTPQLGQLSQQHFAYTGASASGGNVGGGGRSRAPSAPHLALHGMQGGGGSGGGLGLVQQQQQPMSQTPSTVAASPNLQGNFPGYVSQPVSPSVGGRGARRASTVASTVGSLGSPVTSGAYIPPPHQHSQGQALGFQQYQPAYASQPHSRSASASHTGGALAGVPLHEYVTQSVGIPDGLVGSLIGRAGTRISEIRAASGARILIDRVANGNGDRMFQLSGSRAAVEAALRMIYHQLAQEKERRVAQAVAEQEAAEAAREAAMAAEGQQFVEGEVGNQEEGEIVAQGVEAGGEVREAQLVDAE